MKITINNKNNVKKLDLKLKKYAWAVKIFVLSLCLSSIFSIISQTVMSSLGIVMSILTICFFIIISIIFDMVGIAVTSCNKQFFLEKIKRKENGAEVGLLLCKNSEKVCSFCADVVGDICGILSGAGGAGVILSLSSQISNDTLLIIVSTLVSAFIAGVTIFGKACMKEYAIKNADKIILRVGIIYEKIFFKK